MKILIVILIIGTALALPANRPNEDAEVISTSSGASDSSQSYDDTDINFKDFKGVVDTDPGYRFFESQPDPIQPAFFDLFLNTFTQLREGIERSLWSTIKTAELDSDESDGGIKLDPSKTNTTSIVKIIDGHKIEINDTEYTNTDSSGHAIFKVRVIQVRPLDLDDDNDDAVTTTDETGTDIVTTVKSTVINNTEDTKLADGKPLDNEINGNIDSPEVKASNA